MSSAVPARALARRVRAGRRSAAPLAVVAVLLGATGCYTNNNAASQQPYQSADGIDAATGPLELNNLQIVSTGQGGTFVGAITNQGSSADTLQSITVDGTEADVTLASRAIQPLTSLTFGQTGGPQAFVTGEFDPGQLTDVRITFDTAAAVDVKVPVYPRYDYLSPVPTPRASVSEATPSSTIGTAPLPTPSSTVVLSPGPGPTTGATTTPEVSARPTAPSVESLSPQPSTS